MLDHETTNLNLKLVLVFHSSCSDKYCEKHQVEAQLGTTVLLKCEMTISHSVKWAQKPQNQEKYNDFINLTSNGRVEFLDPRSGRVKAFPNHGSKGNYSICIDHLQDSDLGDYRCDKESACVEFNLTQEVVNGNVSSILSYTAHASACGFLSFHGHKCILANP